MSAFSTPYGLKPVNQIGGAPFNGGAVREIRVAANNAAAIFNGDIVILSAAGQPSAATSTPTTSTAGIVGICVGARYIVGGTQQPTWSNFLPANVINGGGSDVWLQVMDDPNTLLQVKGTAALGTFNSGTNGSGWPGAIGKNTTLTFAAGNTTTGVSGVSMTVGANGATLATTNTFAVRIVGLVPETQSDLFPEFYVKWNAGVHSYTAALGV